MKDFKLDSIFTPISERVRTPFYSSFVISWIIINWRIVYVTLFFNEVDFRGLDIINYLIHVKYINLCHNLIYPLASTLCYIFLYPIFDKIIFSYVETKKREKVEEKIRIGNKFSVSGKKYWDLYKELEETLKRFNNISEQNAELNIAATKSNVDFIKLEEQLKIERESSRRLLTDVENYRQRNDTGKLFNSPWQIRLDADKLFFFENNQYYEIRGNEIFEYQTHDPHGKLLFFELDVKNRRLNMLISPPENIVSKELLFLSLFMDAENLFKGRYNDINVVIERKTYKLDEANPSTLTF